MAVGHWPHVGALPFGCCGCNCKRMIWITASQLWSVDEAVAADAGEPASNGGSLLRGTCCDPLILKANLERL